MTAAENLRAAALLVEEALGQLDVTSVGCRTCGAKHFNSLDHERVRVQVVETPDKLRRAADRLEKR